jgi:hypothetical protein
MELHTCTDLIVQCGSSLRGNVMQLAEHVHKSHSMIAPSNILVTAACRTAASSVFDISTLSLSASALAVKMML